MKTMHYYEGGNQKFYQYGENGKVSPYATKWIVTGKREARKVAKAENVKPWNF